MKRIIIACAALVIFTGSVIAKERLVISPDDKIYLETINAIQTSSLSQEIFSAGLIAYASIPDSEMCHINSSSIDPSGRMIGLECYCRLPGVANSDCSKEPQGFYRVVVMNLANKKILLSFDHGYSFQFSSTGAEIAISVEDPSLHSDGCIPPPGFDKAYGLWIYSFENGNKSRIDTQKIGVAEFNWSPHDGNIYVTNNSKIFSYDVKKQKGEIVSIPGIYFSPDGKYNLRTGMSPTIVYNTADWKPAATLNEALSKLGKYQHFTSWAVKGSAMLVTTGNGKYFIVGLEDGRVLREFTGSLIGSNREGTKFLIHPIAADAKGRPRIEKDLIELIEVK